MNKIKVSYVTTLPKEGNAPRVSITGDENKLYHVSFYEKNGGLVSSGTCQTNQTIVANLKQWYTEWLVVIEDGERRPVYHEYFNPKGRVVFIKMDAFALGDNIAWIPYVEAFRVKHNCTVICSTFYNDLFVDAYPNILFVKPNSTIENVYAQYYIGASNDDNPHYSPVKTNEVPLQSVAAKTLGLTDEEINPDLTSRFSHIHPRFKFKYVTLSEFGSSHEKAWKVENGWQEVVNHLVSKGYQVVVISKEPTQLKNIIDMTGNIDLSLRSLDIMHAEFHLGISSGLSWLAWAMGTHVVMVSDVTPNFHEFQSNITRINANELNVINYSVTNETNVSNVIEKLDDLIA